MRRPFSVRIPIILRKEFDQFVIYSPAFDLSSYGYSQKQAEARFNEAIYIFINSIQEKGTLEKVLTELGWGRAKNNWVPPLIKTESKEVQIPAPAT